MDTNANTEGNPSRHVSYEQAKTLIDFMGQHVDFASGSLRTLEARQTSKRLWNDLTNTLNNVRYGTKKSSDAWSKYWSDFKNKLKNKIVVMRQKKRSVGVNKQLRPLTKLEKRALVILGPHFGKKIPHARDDTDPFDNVEATSLPEIKQESFLDDTNDFSRTENQQSDGEKESGSDNSDNEFENSNEVPSDQFINSLYPKWLVDVEKKRAEAELIRAKAEMEKAAIISKNADAALMQAESLKKLSEAAVTQAEAMLRVATALEGLVQNRNFLEM